MGRKPSSNEQSIEIDVEKVKTCGDDLALGILAMFKKRKSS